MSQDKQEGGIRRRLHAVVKRPEPHLLGVVGVTPLVLVIEKLEMLLTPAMRDGRALCLDRGGRRHATKTKTMSAIRMPQHLFLFFISYRHRYLPFLCNPSYRLTQKLSGGGPLSNKCKPDAPPTVR